MLRKDGVLWLNYGDAYCSIGHKKSNSGYGTSNLASSKTQEQYPTHRENNGFGCKHKDLLMLPARVALALQADGWWLRSMMPWLKRSAMPESATDRPATAVEYVFMLTKSARYFYDAEAVRQANTPGSKARIESSPGTGSGMSVGTGGERYARLDGVGTEANGRNFRNSDLFFSSLLEPYGLISDAEGNPLALDVNPAGFAESHFATFPVKLIEPLIKAATSEKGCCPACAAPWVREVERGATTRSGPIASGWREASERANPGENVTCGSIETKTLGWSPSCDCENSFTTVADDPVPCVVLDPFGGAGTTGLVADRLGRDCILIELNPNYAEMARKRISGDAPLFAEVLA